MSVVTSHLSVEQRKKLLSLFDHVRFHLLYKASVHGYSAADFHGRCDKQGPTIITAYNEAGFIFGAYTSKDYAKSELDVHDDKAFLYSITAQRRKPLKVVGINGDCAFHDGQKGPDFGALHFLKENQPEVESIPGKSFNFDIAEMHGSDLKLTELEVYRVEALGDLLAKPWRKMKWTPERREELMKSIQTYQPVLKPVLRARALLLGPIGTGKSSFFNSINSIFRGNMMVQAMAGTMMKSVTTQFRTYSIKDGKGGGVIPLTLCDTMGLEAEADGGLDIEDIVSIYNGHIKDRYQFSTAAPLTPDAAAYQKNVALSDKIHCAVYMIDTSNISLLPQNMLDKFAAIRKKTNLLGIPQIVLMTKVDEACPLVAEDLKNVYRSVYIHKKALELSELLGIPLSSVLPVKNYSSEVDLDEDIDVLLLSAVQHILNYADSFFENQDQDESDQREFYRCNKNSQVV